MTRHLATPDGRISAYPGGGDRLSIAFPVADLQPAHAERIIAGDPGLELIGPSGLAIAGVGLRQVIREDEPHALVVNSEKTQQPIIHVEVEFDGYGDYGPGIIDKIKELKLDTKAGKRIKWAESGIIDGLRGGRFIDTDGRVQLGAQEVGEAYEAGLIAVDPNFNQDPQDQRPLIVKPDGVISLRPENNEFIFNGDTFQDTVALFNALRHSRNGLYAHHDSIPLSPKDVIGRFAVLGVKFSSGPFAWEVSIAGDTVHQINSGRYGDGGRGNGIGSDEDWKSQRQMEVFHDGTTKPTLNDIEVNVRLFRPKVPTRESQYISGQWYGKTPAELRLQHLRGIGPLETLGASDPVVRSVFFSKVDKHYEADKKKTGTLVVSGSGVSEGTLGRTDKFTAQNLHKAAKSAGKNRGIDPRHEDLRLFVENLTGSGDNSRIVIADKLLAEQFTEIVDKHAVAAFLVKDYGDVGMHMATHVALTELARRDVAIGWQQDLPDGTQRYRVMHRNGTWVSPEDYQHLSELDVILAMYGSHVEGLEIPQEAEVDEFFGLLRAGLPNFNLGTVNGDGPAYMEIVNRIGPKHEFFPIGFGIDLSAIGQIANNQTRAQVLLKSPYRSHRQDGIDGTKTSADIDKGALGCNEEGGITFCTEKLAERLAHPTTSHDPDGIWEGLERTLSIVGTLKLERKIGDEVYTSKKPLGDAWVGRTFHRVNTVAEKAKIIIDFNNDPEGYWLDKGIPKKAIKLGLKNHIAATALNGMRMPFHLREAAERYEGPVRSF